MALEQSVPSSTKTVLSGGNGAEKRLEREDLAKLLLLVSKAAQNGYITEEQKG